MPNYRRAYRPGSMYFFTLVTAARAPILVSESGRRCLRSALVDAKSSWPFEITALVLLPDHLHAIWSLPRGDVGYPRRWAWIKRTFTVDWLAGGGKEAAVSRSKRKARRRGVWQRRYWEHALENENDLERHCDYIHYNPVKHGLVRCPSEWPYSSFHRFVRSGDYDADWGCGTSPAPSFDDLDQTAME
jgi:putative transposase